MSRTEFQIRAIKAADRDRIVSFISENWGSSLVVSRGKIHDASTLAGFIYMEDEQIIGLITYKIEKDACEIVSLDSKSENQGLGTSLLNKVLIMAKEAACQKVWLITTNDNTRAIRFYQKRGFDWTGFHQDAIKLSRKLKPQIPKRGFDGIPIRHELEFEFRFN